MPIVRTYACAECNHMMEVMLSLDQWETEPPECPECQRRAMRQEFRPVAITGSNVVRARDIAEDIADKDYHVADMTRDKHAAAPTVRYKDQVAKIAPSEWQAASATLEAAISSGRQTRLKYGSGLDVLQHNLKTGAEPDLIAQSKKRLIKVW